MDPIDVLTLRIEKLEQTCKQLHDAYYREQAERDKEKKSMNVYWLQLQVEIGKVRDIHEEIIQKNKIR